MREEAQFRTFLAQAVLGQLESVGGPAALAELQAREPEAYRATTSSSRLTWLPADAYVRILVGASEVVAPSKRQALLQSFGLDTHAHPMVGGALHVGSELFGQGPGSLFKPLPVIWGLSTRGAGEMSVEVADEARSLTVGWRRIPAPCLRSDFIEALGVAISALFERSQLRAQMRVELEPGAPSARYDYSW